MAPYVQPLHMKVGKHLAYVYQECVIHFGWVLSLIVCVMDKVCGPVVLLISQIWATTRRDNTMTIAPYAYPLHMKVGKHHAYSI